MFSDAENFLQKSSFSIVNRNRRQWAVEHLHATAGDFPPRFASLRHVSAYTSILCCVM